MSGERNTTGAARSRFEWPIIARREFLERVRTKWFIIVTVLGPIALIGLIVLPAWLQAKSADNKVDIAVVDKTPERLGDQLEGPLKPANFHLESVAPDTPRDALNTRLRRKSIDGFLVLPPDTLHGGEAVYEGDNTSNLMLMARLQLLLNGTALTMRAQQAGITDEQLAKLGQPVRFTAKQNTGMDDTRSGQGVFILGLVIMILLYMAIVFYAVNVMRSVVLEKTSRVVEIMVSAVKPRSLMLGKILGVGAVGLFQLAIWATVSLLVLEYRGQILSLFGQGDIGGISVPSVRATDLALIMAYFITGYFLYAALYAAIGAVVNSDQEAQQAQMPVILLLVIPMLCAQIVITDPRGDVAEIMTLIPFFSPVLMPMRYLLGGATSVDVALSLGILCTTLVCAVFLSARIYRVGILMYGKRPSISEVIRWMRHK